MPNAPVVDTWAPAEPVLARCAEWGGSALAVSLFVDVARRAGPSASGEVPFVLAVGNAVRRGVPTAARVTVASRGAQSERYSEGQVGGDLALRLAGFADAIVLTGQTKQPGAVLELDGEGSARLHLLDSLAGLGASATRARLRARFGEVAALYVGPGAERGIRFATLMSGLDHTSHVGRGGLGVAFARTGLKAVVFTGEPLEVDRGAEGTGGSIVNALVSSPRLRARAEGGTHELWSAFQVRGELRGKNYAEPLSSEAASQLWRESRESTGERHGCPGCPTPCGYVVKGSDGTPKSGPRFGAAWALGPNLGFDRLGSAQALFEACDEAGIDAKETGAVLALLMRAKELGRHERGPSWATADAAEAALDAMLAAPLEASSGALGGQALAEELSLANELFSVHGQSARPDLDLASLLGQCVSSNGADPMRSFPFATGDGLGRERLARLFSGLALPEGTEDGRDPRGVGRLVWWHENFVAAVDAAGFCSFSAGSLVSDGVVELDELASWLAPRGLDSPATGSELLELGAAVVWLRRELSALWGSSAEEAWPEWARAALTQPGVWDEYRAARGLTETGALDELARERFLRGELFAHGRELLAAKDGSAPVRSEESERPEAADSARLGRVSLRSSGPLGDRLGGEVELEVVLPAPVDRVLAELATARPPCRSYLFRGTQPLAAVYRDGRLLAPAELVRSGDQLELVVAVSGG